MIKKSKVGRPKGKTIKSKREKDYKCFNTIELEEWRYIKGTDNCYVSNEGRVKWVKKIYLKDGEYKTRELLLPFRQDPKGYYRVTLKYPENATVKDRRKRVHVLVSEAFIPNPENKPVVNHIDGNRKDFNFVNVHPDIDSRKTNLEWTTYSENNLHAYQTGLREGPRKDTSKNKARHTYIIALNKNTRECHLFSGQMAASRGLNIDRTQINHNLHNDGLTCHGWIFGYLDEKNMNIDFETKF